MGKWKRRGYSRQAYESSKPGKRGNDYYVAMHAALTNSPMWHALTGNQRELYRFCLSRFRMKPRPSEIYPDCEAFQGDGVFFMNWAIVKAIGLYGSRHTFYQDITRLAECGLVVCLYNGKTQGKKSVYKLAGPSESLGAGPYVALYASMTNSPMWHALTGSQRELYRFCRSQYSTKDKPPEVKGVPTSEMFFMNWAIAVKTGLYKDKKAFYRDVKSLVSHGFIEHLPGGDEVGKKSVYRYSSQWWKNEGSEK